MKEAKGKPSFLDHAERMSIKELEEQWAEGCKISGFFTGVLPLIFAFALLAAIFAIIYFGLSIILSQP